MPAGSRSRFSPWRLAPVVLALVALPLMAPTCGGGAPGLKAFSKGSLIIPMDACYQGDASVTPATGCPTVGTTTRDVGNVIRAYGLVYQLVSNGIPVYWIIDQNKTQLTGIDFTVQYVGGAPVAKYDWANDALGAMPPNNNTNVVNYLGGPFVVDGSDAARARAVLKNVKGAFGPANSGGSAVNVHFTNVAFQAYAAKTMTGLWTGGGAKNLVPPIALLDITGGDGKNSEIVVQGYLDKAGLGTADFPGAGGTSSAHGKIYDRLQVADFLPSYAGSALARTNAPDRANPQPSDGQGYRVLWIPHWYGPGSTKPTGGTITQADLDAILATIAGFSQAGRDIFAECAGLGTLEGVLNDSGFGAGNAATRFQTSAELNINETALANAKFWDGNFATPFLQLGDFPYKPITGAIQQYRPPGPASGYKAGVVRFISDSASTDKDYFTMLPSPPGSGNVVYLAGHDYAGTQGYSLQIAGARLVLNTLFNLSTTCVSTGAACNTGLLGECAVGTLQCDPQTGQPACIGKSPSAETCDGKDNDCNGVVDDVPISESPTKTASCYDGPAGTANTGICHDGVWQCDFSKGGPNGGWQCVGAQKPAPEICNDLDDDCNGKVDDNVPPPPGQNASCYTGPSGTAGKGICKAGTWSCSAGIWSCPDEVLPKPETCGEGVAQDENCDGNVNENCSCVAGTTEPCYRGPPGTAGIGICHTGTHRCVQDPSAPTGVGAWESGCTGDVTPQPETCNQTDDDCDGFVDKTVSRDDRGNITAIIDACAECGNGKPATQGCYTGPAGTRGVGACADGQQACAAGYFDTSSCPGQILPATELCDGRDNDCNGKIDDGATCPSGLACINGACTFANCSGEASCRDGYACDTGTGKCVPAPCGTSGVCPAGNVCSGGKCIDPCAGVTCGQGATCSGGACVGGGCFATGCAAGEICVAGACQADACAGLACPAGTFCRRGDCVQSCAFMQCAVGERCGPDGFCAADACSNVTCATAGDVCGASGTCAADPCASVRCGERQTCIDGLCTDDPCAGVVCPVGQCLRGQCFSSRNPQGLGTEPPPATDPGTSSAPKGGGCGAGEGGLLSLAMLALALGAARRFHRPFALSVAQRSRRAKATSLPFTAFALALAALLGAACSSGGGSSTPSKPQPAVCSGSCGAVKCVDLAYDADNCGACGVGCGAGNVCVDSKCGPASAVAPALTAVSPAPLAAGLVHQVTVTGQRFQAGAKLRIADGAVDPTEIDAVVTDAQHLSVALDLAGYDPGTLELRVVNADRVISNAWALTVVTPTPTGLVLSPSEGITGKTATAHVTATGLTANSLCLFGPHGGTMSGVPTAHAAGGLDCTLDLTLVAPGAYDVVVQNDGAVRSAAAAFTVRSSSTVPTLSAVSPSSGKPGDIVRVKVTGTGFDPGSAVQIDGTSVPTTFVASTQLYADLALTGFAPGTSHPVRVVNGAAASGTAQFTIDTAPPAALSLSVTPAQPQVGDAVQLDVGGVAFDASCKLQVQPPGGAFATLAATQLVGASEVKGSTTPSAAGTWNARVECTVGGAAVDTAAFPFQVLTNAAVLANVSPAGAAQGEAKVVTLTGSNFKAGVTLTMTDHASFTRNVTPTSVTPTALTASIDATGLAATTYGISAKNPGAAASGEVGFAVTPGVPTLTSIAPTSLALGGGTKDVVLSGTNFAPGASGTSVHAKSADVQGGLEFVLPIGTSVTIKAVTASTITLSVDPTALVPATYAIWVVNPGSAGPQKSASQTLTIAP